MQKDDIVWEIIGETFCSFRVKGPYDGYKDNNTATKYCKHPYNLTGKCEFKYCPLANSKYCTVINEEKKVYLMVKTPERVHFPNKAWERFDLPDIANLSLCEQEMDKIIKYFPEEMKEAAHQRLLIYDKLVKRIDRINNSDIQEEITPVRTKEMKREKNREKHAIKAANLEMNIEKELLSRAMQGVFGDHEILNIDRNLFKQKVNEGELGEQESLNESMDSQLTGEVAMGMDLEDIGDEGVDNTQTEYEGEINNFKTKESNTKKDVKPKTKIATRLKTLKKLSNQMKRKREYQLEKEERVESNNQIKIY